MTGSFATMGGLSPMSGMKTPALSILRTKTIAVSPSLGTPTRSMLFATDSF